MRKNKKLALVVVSIFLATLWGCGSSLDSGGDQTGPGTGAAAKLGSDTCKVCHSTIAIDQGFNGSFHDDDTVAGCEGCHGGGQFHKGIGPIPVPAPGLAKCNVCHATKSPGFLARHKGDLTATSFQTTPNDPIVEGYTNVDDCLGCHAAKPPVVTPEWYHNPNSTEINKQWAKSGHAGKIASATPDTGTVWGHYNWDDTASRGSCQRCHTATGAKNFLTLTGDGDPATTYASSGNDFSHLAGWTPTNKTSGQNELLYCWACHSDVATGVLRNPGAITEAYARVNQAVTPADPPPAPGTFINTVADTGTAVTVNYPNVGASNVCMACHLGREVGANIAAVTSSDGILSFVNSHYLTAGATIFNESGYEFAGQVYNNIGYHKNVGVTDTAGTGTNGPCVTCHMSGAESHSFEVVTKDAAGVITAVTSTTCVNCHGAMTPAVLEEKKEEFHLAMDALKLALEGKGIYFSAHNPYFFTAPWIDYTPPAPNPNVSFTNWQSVATAIGVGVDWRNVMGAAFNYNLFEHDPGAYAHNRTYALALIRDSIDVLNDGLVDGDSSIVRTMVRAGFDMGTVDSSANPLHTAAIASAILDPASGATTCTACHKAAAHFGATTTASTPAQWVAPFDGTFKPCSNCHANEVIGANTAILDQYATSNHGDVNGAWNHVNPVGTAVAFTTVAATDYRTWCGRCHTTQGFIDLTGDNVSNVGTGVVQLWPTVVGETTLDAVGCDACHEDLSVSTAPRALGGFTVSYYSGVPSANAPNPPNNFNIAVDKTYPDVGPSSICVRCHSGRDSSGIGQLIKDGTPTNAATVIRTHYLGSGLTLFNTGGYHFGADPTVYTSLGSHKTIAAAGDGPCVTCHMSGTAGHTFWPIEEDETTGAITAVLSGACTTCHGASMTAAYLTEVRNDFKTVKAALEAALEVKGIFYRNAQETAGSTGRFYTSSAHSVELTYNNPTVANNPTYLSLAGGVGNEAFAKDLMGAAFNLAFVDYIQEPGAYVHNWEYARKLLIDSIDVLNDGLVDGDNIPAAVTAINAKYPSL